MRVPALTRLAAGVALLLALGPDGASAADCVGVAVTAIPSCAQSCFLNGAPTIGCGSFDFGCQCNQEAALYAAIEGCVATACAASMFQSVIDGASSVCGCATADSGSGGLVTVSGSVRTYSTASSFATTGSSFATTTSASATATASTATATAGGGSYGPEPTPSYYTTSSVVSGSNRLSTVHLGVLGSFTAVALLFVGAL